MTTQTTGPKSNNRQETAGEIRLFFVFYYLYNGKGNIVRSIDILNQKEYTYTYDGEKISRAAECDITLGSNEIITGKTLVSSVLYTYDSEDKLTKKRIIPVNGTEQVIYYETPDDDNTVVKFQAGGKTVTAHSKTDSFGRKEFDELQLGKGFVSRQFHYYEGQKSQTHIDNDKMKSSPTTQLVSRIVLSGGRTLDYEYDAEERITKVIDSVDGVTEYTYDAMGQLLTESVDGVVVSTMTYDNYGNILTKNGVSYEYDSTWKDLLTKVGNDTITYDAQGNPTSYLGHTLTWEKGRQLKSFDSNTYTYNANGVRTSKTVNGVTHTYMLDGSNILRETWNGNTMVPLYNNEENVCGITYNATPYYFVKNLQGDIIAITNQNAEIVAKYSYDAWGVCTITQDTSTVGIASINPYRYRGYYFDSEIGMYYLQSRYYNPVVGRFINQDDPNILTLVEVAGQSYESSLKINSFAYCCNSPVKNWDPTGMLVWSISGIVFECVVGIGAGIQISWIYDGCGNHGLMVSVFWGFGVSIALSWTGFLSWRRTIYDMKGMSSSLCLGFTVYGIGMGVSLFMDSQGIAGVGLSVGVSLWKYGGYGAFVVADVIPLNRYVRLDKEKIKVLMQNLRCSITMRIQNGLYGRYR